MTGGRLTDWIEVSRVMFADCRRCIADLYFFKFGASELRSVGSWGAPFGGNGIDRDGVGHATILQGGFEPAQLLLG